MRTAMKMPGPEIRRRFDPALAVAVAASLALGLAVYTQGFSLLDDGLWLLGGKLLVEGRRLFVDFPSIHGPTRYLLLAPFFLLLGKSALALAVLKAVVTAAASGLGFFAARRLGAGRLVWLVPLGLVGLGPVDPRYAATGAFALIVGRATTARPARRCWRPTAGTRSAPGGRSPPARSSPWPRWRSSPRRPAPSPRRCARRSSSR